MTNLTLRSLLLLVLGSLASCKDFETIPPVYTVFEKPWKPDSYQVTYADAIQTEDCDYVAVGQIWMGNGARESLFAKYRRTSDTPTLHEKYGMNSEATCVKASKGDILIGGRDQTWGYVLKVDNNLKIRYREEIGNTKFGYNSSQVEDMDIAPDGQIVALVSVEIGTIRSLFVFKFRDTGNGFDEPTRLPINIPNTDRLDYEKMSLDVSEKGVIAVAATLEDPTDGTKSGFLAQMTMDGVEVKRSKQYKYPGTAVALRDVVVSPQGNCYAVGYKNKSALYVNWSDNAKWEEKPYTLPKNPTEAYGISLSPEGDLAIVGGKNSGIESQVLFFKVKALTGDKDPDWEYGTGKNNSGKSIAPIMGGGFLMSGFSTNGTNDRREAYLIKTDPEGRAN